MSIQELEKAISTLKPDELHEFSSWFENFIAEQWDLKFEQDVQSGNLDHLVKEADALFESGDYSEL